jgi:hypothetical protein
MMRLAICRGARSAATASFPSMGRRQSQAEEVGLPGMLRATGSLARFKDPVGVHLALEPA